MAVFVTIFCNRRFTSYLKAMTNPSEKTAEEIANVIEHFASDGHDGEFIYEVRVMGILIKDFHRRKLADTLAEQINTAFSRLITAAKAEAFREGVEKAAKVAERMFKSCDGRAGYLAHQSLIYAGSVEDKIRSLPNSYAPEAGKGEKGGKE